MPSPRILVVKLSSLGDLFHALPAVHALCQEWGLPADWVTQTEYAELVGCFTDVERVIAFPRHGWPGRFGAFLRELRREAYTMVLDLQGLLKSALVARLARSARRVGLRSSREGASRLYSERVGPPGSGVHAVEEALQAVRELGVPVGSPEFPVSFPPLNADLPRPRVALVPCSRWLTKNWPAESFRRVAGELQERAGASVVLMGAAVDQAVCAAIAGGLPGRTLDLCGRTSLVELGGWMREMDLVISVDSGPMHVAAALGRPVLALFGPTDPRRTGPYGQGHCVLQVNDLECRPCQDRRCRRNNLACLRRLEPSQVVAAALQMLRAT